MQNILIHFSEGFHLSCRKELKEKRWHFARNCTATLHEWRGCFQKFEKSIKQGFKVVALKASVPECGTMEEGIGTVSRALFHFRVYENC